MSKQYKGGLLMSFVNTKWRLLEKWKYIALYSSLIIIFGGAANAQIIILPETGQNACYT
jgi:hypothetical protein